MRAAREVQKVEAKLAERAIEDQDELASVEASIDAMEQAVVDGDDSVTPEQIDVARGRLRFLKLQHEGRRQRREAAAAAKRLEVSDALADAVVALAKRSPDQPGNGGRPGNAYAKAEQALTSAARDYLTQVAEYNAAAGALDNEGAALGVDRETTVGRLSAYFGDLTARESSAPGADMYSARYVDGFACLERMLASVLRDERLRALR